jgi:hypothetical protein
VEISGRVTTNGTPILDGYIKVRRHNIEGPVSFLVDTGADVTVLMPKDAMKLGVDYSLLGKPTKARGVGASAKCYRVEAMVSLRDEDDEPISHRIILAIIEPDSKGANMGMPSLLGRDIINEYRMIFDAYSSRLYLGER